MCSLYCFSYIRGPDPKKNTMNSFAKIPIEKCTALLGIQDRKERRYRYIKGSDDLMCLDNDAELRKNAGNIDYLRTLDMKARKTVHRLEYNSTYLKTMKAASVKVYIILHFLVTDFTSGTIQRAMFSELSREAGCTERTIKASLESLRDEGYITYEKLNARYFSASVCDYAGMFRKAKDGGHGYITMSLEAASRILSLRRINDLRIAVVSLFESVQNERNSSAKELGAVIPFDRYMEAVPGYMRPCHIRKAVEALSGLLGEFSETYKEYRVRLDGVFNPRPIQNTIRQQARTVIRERFADIQRCVEAFNRELEESLCVNHEMSELFRPLGLKYNFLNQKISQEEIKNFRFSEIHYNADLIDSLSGIAVTFNLPIVLKAISVYYREYVNCSRSIEVKNVPGLITAIVKDELRLQEPYTA